MSEGPSKEVRWAAKAAWDLEQALDYSDESGPLLTARLVAEIEALIGTLKKFPALGRPGQLFGTREYVMPEMPFVLIYTIDDGALQIVRLLHTSRRWPGAKRPSPKRKR